MTQEEREHMKKVYSSALYGYLRHNGGRKILALLWNQEISIGKAAEAITEQFELGVEPILPELKEADV